MKKLIIPLIIFLFFSCQTTTEKNQGFFSIIGTWSGTDSSNETGSFTFDKDGFCVMRKGREVIGGRNYQNKGSLKYTVNFNTTPIQLDIIAFKPNGEERGRMKAIIKIVNNDTIMMRINFKGKRPGDFKGSTPRDTMTLHRQ